MDRRSFLKWLGGGVAAVAALSNDQVLKAQQLFGVTGEVDPESLLWLPGEGKVIVPEDKPLIIATRPAGVGCFRVTAPGGTFWYDPDWRLVDAFDRHGRPTTVFGADGPNLNEAKRAIGPIGPEWFKDVEIRKRGGVPRSYNPMDRRFDKRTSSGLYISCWPELIYESTERPVVATMSLGPISTDGVFA